MNTDLTTQNDLLDTQPYHNCDAFALTLTSSFGTLSPCSLRLSSFRSATSHLLRSRQAMIECIAYSYGGRWTPSIVLPEKGGTEFRDDVYCSRCADECREGNHIEPG
ncbi:hypothetical protein M404DRAFT_1006087 [Pisolithus tinctorius Marx 270]|uniref:Uncharacterized protein n=1 Tax=Pisolithus tinctorius Marx 270 TaxID=870435 RepID=A0A0C3NPD8_PISTI|nr:hypothetical protein M404DRAFT_1006087 [Pisolithus tinctorius Marx 270]